MKLIKRIAFGSAGLLVLLMMAATVVEKLQGTGTAWDGYLWLSVLYHTVGNPGGMRFGLPDKPETATGFFYVPAAHSVSDYPGRSAHHAPLRKARKHPFAMNDTPVSAFVTSGTEEEPLPFDVRLHDFRIDYYKGSFAPMDFTSRIRIEDNGMQAEGEVSMNRIFTYRHYRFYQSAYDKDGARNYPCGVLRPVGHRHYLYRICFIAALCLGLLFSERQHVPPASPSSRVA